MDEYLKYIVELNEALDQWEKYGINGLPVRPIPGYATSERMPEKTKAELKAKHLQCKFLRDQTIERIKKLRGKR